MQLRDGVSWVLRDYQEKAANEVVVFLRTASQGARRLYVSPCGTGKSLIELAVLRELGPECSLVTPRVEIIDGLVEKGANPAQLWTPVTLRNRLIERAISAPRWVLSDEGHHDTCDTADTIRLCVGDVPTVAFTATPFRGTPQGTAALRTLYGDPHYVLTLADAVERGLCVIPACTTVPILDDDIVEVTGGEFKVRAVETKTPWRAAADLVYALWQTPRPTVVCLPGVQAVRILAEALDGRVPARCVTGDTNAAARNDAFHCCVAGEAVMLQVQVVSEGVDLPIRRLIDFAPTMSPVRWLQQVGRAMRPGEGAEYVCANRNLLRHGYLLEGLLPSDAFAQAQGVFPVLSCRTSVRAFGLEGVGRLRPCRVPLASGLVASAYYVTRTEGHVATQYVAIVLPHSPTPLWASRVNAGGYGKWVKCVPPTELSGFASIPPRPLSSKQEAWWCGAAAKYGLDAKADVDAKAFAVLPVLSDLRIKIT